jgi:ELWxxDGT repeat protein
MAAELYFSADNGSTGAELFSYDDTAVTLRANINPGAAGSNPSELTPYNGLLYFRANDGATGEELWRFNGTTASRASAT